MRALLDRLSPLEYGEGRPQVFTPTASSATRQVVTPQAELPDVELDLLRLESIAAAEEEFLQLLEELDYLDDDIQPSPGGYLN